MTGAQESSCMALACIFESVRVRERVDADEPVIAEGCEWPDELAPRIVARFEIDEDGTLRQVAHA